MLHRRKYRNILFMIAVILALNNKAREFEGRRFIGQSLAPDNPPMRGKTQPRGDRGWAQKLADEFVLVEKSNSEVKQI